MSYKVKTGKWHAENGAQASSLWGNRESRLVSHPEQAGSLLATQAGCLCHL